MSTPRDRDLTMFTIYDRLGEMDVTGAARAIPGRSIMIDQAAFMQVVHHVGLVPAAILEVLSGLATLGPDGTLSTRITREELADLLSAKEGGGMHSGFRKDALTGYLRTLQTAGYLSHIRPTGSNHMSPNRFILRHSLVLINGGQTASESAVVGTPQTPTAPADGIPVTDSSAADGISVSGSIGAGHTADGIPVSGGSRLAADGNPVTGALRREPGITAGRGADGIPAAEETAPMVSGVGSSSAETSSTTTHHDERWAAVDSAARSVGFQGSLTFLRSFDPGVVTQWIEAIRHDPAIHRKGAYLRMVLRDGSTPPEAPLAPPRPFTPELGDQREAGHPGAYHVASANDPRVGAAPWDGGVVLRMVQIRQLIDDHDNEYAKDKISLATVIREANDRAVKELGYEPTRDEASAIYCRVATQILVDAGLVGSGSGQRSRRLVVDEAAASDGRPGGSGWSPRSVEEQWPAWDEGDVEEFSPRSPHWG